MVPGSENLPESLIGDDPDMTIRIGTCNKIIGARIDRIERNPTYPLLGKLEETIGIGTYPDGPFAITKDWSGRLYA